MSDIYGNYKYTNEDLDNIAKLRNYLLEYLKSKVNTKPTSLRQHIVPFKDKKFAWLKSFIDSGVFTSCLILGNQGTGKSTLSRYIFKILYDLFYNTYNLFFFTVEGLENMSSPNVLTLSMMNQKIRKAPKPYDCNLVCICWDDASYITSAKGRKEASLEKSLYATIRHQIFRDVPRPTNDEDHKIFVLIIAHAVNAIPPIYRSANGVLFTSSIPYGDQKIFDILSVEKDKKDTIIAQLNLIDTINNNREITSNKTGVTYYINQYERACLVIPKGVNEDSSIVSYKIVKKEELPYLVNISAHTLQESKDGSTNHLLDVLSDKDE